MGRPWQDYLKPEERRFLQETEGWIERPQGLVGKALSLLGRPLDMAYAAAPGNLKESVSQGIYSALTKVRGYSEATVRPQQIFDSLSAEGGLDVTTPEQVRRLPLQAVDRVARRIVNSHRGAALLEGGATGAAGLPGLIADIPALYYLVFKAVLEVSWCYGFPPDDPRELDHIFKVVDVGHYLESEKKRKGMLELERLQDMIASGAPLKDLERAFIAKGLQQLARQLATAITRRKLAQTVALVGSVVGASVNSALLADVGDTAFYAYRRRFLMELALTRKHREEGSHAAASPGPTSSPPTAATRAPASGASAFDGSAEPPKADPSMPPEGSQAPGGPSPPSASEEPPASGGAGPQPTSSDVAPSAG